MFLWSNENSLPFPMILSTQVSPTVAACPRYHRGPLPLLPSSPKLTTRNETCTASRQFRDLFVETAAGGRGSIGRGCKMVHKAMRSAALIHGDLDDTPGNAFVHGNSLADKRSLARLLV
jgi:hypothetical protein